MLKVFSALMVAALVGNSAFAAPVIAPADHQDMIAKAFEQFSYSVSVNLDTKDSASKDIALIQLKDRLSLLESNGVTPIEMMDYVRNHILDRETRIDFDRLLVAMKEGAITPDAASQLAMKFIENSKTTGAHFLGGKGGQNPILIVAGVVIVGAVTYYTIRYVMDNGLPFFSAE
jgi:uncharacterized protein (UPF0371 family)